jgi:hypothetical protein
MMSASRTEVNKAPAATQADEACGSASKDLETF